MTARPSLRLCNNPTRGTLWVVLAVLAIAATVISYLFLDQPLMYRLFQGSCDWHRHTWTNGFRQLGKAYLVLWLMLLWSCLSGRWRLTLVTATAMILVSMAVCPLKAVVARSRPRSLLTASAPSGAPQAGDRIHRVSFPSGDTAVAFAAAGVIAASLPVAWTPILLLAASLIGLLRVTALVHYPSDVFAGAAIGLLAAWQALRTPLEHIWQTPPHHRMTARQLRRLRRWLPILLVFVAPFLYRDSMWPFLKVFGMPVVVLMTVGAAVLRHPAPPRDKASQMVRPHRVPRGFRRRAIRRTAQFQRSGASLKS